MTAYLVQGHPLNPNDLGLTSAEADLLRAALQINGVGQTVNLTLSGSGDTKAKGHGAVK